MHIHDHTHHDEIDTGSISPEYIATCPVTGDTMDIREAEKLGHFRDAGSKRIYLCCATCVKLFDEHPGAYSHETHKSHDL